MNEAALSSPRPQNRDDSGTEELLPAGLSVSPTGDRVQPLTPGTGGLNDLSPVPSGNETGGPPRLRSEPDSDCRERERRSRDYVQCPTPHGVSSRRMLLRFTH